jgi:histidinol dehydrogenase
LPPEGQRAIRALAEVEGLEAHAHSARLRAEPEN